MSLLLIKGLKLFANDSFPIKYLTKVLVGELMLNSNKIKKLQIDGSKHNVLRKSFNVRESDKSNLMKT